MHAHAHARTFLIARHFAASWKPTIVSGEQILRKGNSEFRAICAASAVLPLLGGPTTQQRIHKSLLHFGNYMVPIQVHFYRPQLSCSKVMFSQASVTLFTGGEVWQTPPGQTTPGQTPPADGYCSGRYESYWNAFLLKLQLNVLTFVVDSHTQFKMHELLCTIVQ